MALEIYEAYSVKFGKWCFSIKKKCSRGLVTIFFFFFFCASLCVLTSKFTLCISENFRQNTLTCFISYLLWALKMTLFNDITCMCCMLHTALSTVKLDQLKCWTPLCSLKNFLNMDRREHHSLDCLKERKMKKGSGQYSTFKVGNHSCSAKQTLFQEQPWGDFWETGQSVYGPFQALQCHRKQKLKLWSRVCIKHH